jgi:hypothetical protein
MAVSRIASVLAVVSSGLLVAACGGSSSSAEVDASASLAPDHPLIVVERWAGTTPWATVDAPRRLTLTADGTLVAQQPPGDRVYPVLTATTLDADTLHDVWTGAVNAGLGTDARLPLPGVFDAETTVVTLDDGGRHTELQIYALGDEGAVADVAGISERDLALRQSVGRFLDALLARAGTTPYSAPQVALWIAPAGDDESVRPIPWTSSIVLDTVGTPVEDAYWVRCAILDGAAADEVAGIGLSLPTSGEVVQAETAWRIGMRPIMPDEVGRIGCPSAR